MKSSTAKGSSDSIWQAARRHGWSGLVARSNSAAIEVENLVHPFDTADGGSARQVHCSETIGDLANLGTSEAMQQLVVRPELPLGILAFIHPVTTPRRVELIEGQPPAGHATVVSG